MDLVNRDKNLGMEVSNDQWQHGVGGGIFSLDFVIIQKRLISFNFMNFQAPAVWKKYQTLCDAAHGEKVNFLPLERFDFYKRAKQAFCIVATSEQAAYGNIIIKKGCVRIQDENTHSIPEVPSNKQDCVTQIVRGYDNTL